MQSALGPSTPTGATAFRKIKCQAMGGDAVPAIHVRQLGDCVLCAAWRHRQSTLGHTGMSLRARHLKTLCNWLLPGDAAQVAAVVIGRRARGVCPAGMWLMRGRPPWCDSPGLVSQSQKEDVLWVRVAA